MAEKKAGSGTAATSGTTATPPTTTTKKVIGKPFAPGNRGGPGRPRMPAFLKNGGKSEAVLKELEKAALGKMALDKTADWLRAVTLYLEYTVGPPKSARSDTVLPATPEERIALLEDLVLEAAIAGNAADAAVRMLEALDPTRWGKKQSEGEMDDQNDTLDWVPMVKTN